LCHGGDTDPEDGNSNGRTLNPTAAQSGGTSDSPLYVLQEQAKTARRGLWSDPHPTAPWEWRKHEWDRKGVAPAGIENSSTIRPEPQAAPKWVCERREVAGQVFE